MSARTDATARVTALVATWLWRQGSRAMAREVGLCPVQGLVTPWRGRWRVDLGAVSVDGDRESVHVVEVKGTDADLAREDLVSGKWQMDFSARHLHPWLAVDHRMRVPEMLPAAWGVLVVGYDSVTVRRRPPDVSTKFKQTPQLALAEVVTAQRLPTIMGLSGAGAAAAMLQAGFSLPWLDWTSVPRPQDLVTVDEDAKVL